MRKAVVSTFLVLFFSICAVTELRASPDSDRDEPFGMAKLDLAKFVAPKGSTWREWRKIKANVEAEMRELAKCRTEPDRCNAAERWWNGVKFLSKMFRLSDGKTIAPSTNPTSHAPVSNLKKN